MTGSSNGTELKKNLAIKYLNCPLFRLTRRLETRECREHQKHDRIEDEAKIVHHVLGRLPDALINEPDSDGHEEVNQDAHHGH